MGKAQHYIRRIACIPIFLYRGFIKPWLRPCCRFYPSCSEYALQAIQKKGIVRGFFLIVSRLLKCHPYHPGGIDEVPADKVSMYRNK